MLWLVVTILAYFFLAVAAFGDKFLLTGHISSPKVYSFYVGILSIFVVVLIPFGFFFPSVLQVLLAFLCGAIFLLGLYIYYSLVKEFEISRIAPAVGGLVPVLTFLFVYIFLKGTINISLREAFSFLLLISGSVLITSEKLKNIFGKTFIFSLGAAFYFSLYFVLSKIVYTNISFINGFIWIRLGGVLAALFFLFSKEVRAQISFKPQQGGNIKTMGLFIGNQAGGSIGSVLQSWAVALAPLVFVAFINALQGIQYAFLFLFTLLFSVKFPNIFKEEISKKIVIQKTISILIIGVGLLLLVLK